ncbi:MAG: glycosyltransferase 87 family protein [Solirubrobacteraceae bacterium]
MLARINKTVWPIAGLVWIYETLHEAHKIGTTWPALYRGPYDLLHGLAPYPTTANSVAWYAATNHAPFYVFTPSSALILTPFGLLGEIFAGELFMLLSGAVFAAGLYLLARRTPIAALIMLGAGLSLPLTSEFNISDADLLAAGLIALALATGGGRRAAFMCLAMAVKPTAWYVVAVLGVPGLIGLSAAVGLNLIGLAVVRDSGRFFENVIPFLAHGQQHVDTLRVSLPDAASSLGLPHSDVSVVTGLALILALAWILFKRREIGNLERCAPLVVLLGLTLSSYCFVQYVVYLIVVLPLLEPRESDLPLLGIALYLICAPDVWSSSSFPNALNVALSYKVLAGLLLLIPVAARPVLDLGLGKVRTLAEST